MKDKINKLKGQVSKAEEKKTRLEEENRELKKAVAGGGGGGGGKGSRRPSRRGSVDSSVDRMNKIYKSGAGNAAGSGADDAAAPQRESRKSTRDKRGVSVGGGVRIGGGGNETEGESRPSSGRSVASTAISAVIIKKSRRRKSLPPINSNNNNNNNDNNSNIDASERKNRNRVEVENLKSQIQRLEEENKVLKRVHLQHVKLLERFDKAEADLPRLLKEYDEDVGNLREQLRRSRSKQVRVGPRKAGYTPGQSRAVGQGAYLRPLDRLGRSSEAKDRKNQKK